MENKKTVLIVSLVLIGIIIFSLGISNNWFVGLKPLSLYGQGLTIKSMSSNVNVISQDTDLKGVWWLINAYTGGGQSISGTLTPEDTKQLIGYQTTYPLNIKVSALNEKINYIIQNTGTKVYSYSDTVIKSDCSCTSSCLLHPNANSCPSGTDYQISFSGEANFFTSYVCERHCFKKVQIGVLGTVAPSNVKGDVSVTLSNNGETITKNIEVGGSADFVGSKGLIAQVQYPANGWTGNYPKDTSNFYAIYDIFGGKNQWTLTSKQRYVEYNSQKAVFENFISSFQQTKYSGSTVKQQYQNALSDLNNKISKLNSEVIGMRSDDLSINQNQVWGNRNDQNNGKIILDTPGQLSIADLVFRIRADWLGIVINVGKPSIVQSQCQKFKAGDTSKISLKVENIGGADGNFVPSVICNNIKQTYNIFSIPINKGETKTIEVPIDAGNFAPSSTSSDSCKIRVEEYNKPSNYAESYVTCSIEPPALCVEGTVDTSGNCIKKCVNGKPTQLKCCKDGESLLLDPTKLNDEFGGYYCYNGSDGGGIITSNKCDTCLNWFTSLFKSKESKCETTSLIKTRWWNPFSWIINLTGIGSQNIWCPIFLGIVLLVFIFGTLFGQQIFYSFRALQDKVWITWLLGLGGGLLLSLITYYAFIVGIIAFIIYIIIRMVIGSTIGKVTRFIK